MKLFKFLLLVLCIFVVVSSETLENTPETYGLDNALPFLISSTPVIYMGESYSPYVVVINTQFPSVMRKSSNCKMYLNMNHPIRDFDSKYTLRFIYHSASNVPAGTEYTGYLEDSFHWYSVASGYEHEIPCLFPKNMPVSLVDPQIRVEIVTQMYARYNSYQMNSLTATAYFNSNKLQAVLPGPVLYSSLTESNPSIRFDVITNSNNRALSKIKLNTLKKSLSSFTLFFETHNVFFQQHGTANCTLKGEPLDVSFGADPYSVRFKLSVPNTVVRGDKVEVRCYDNTVRIVAATSEENAFRNKMVYTVISNDSANTATIAMTDVMSSTSLTLVAIILSCIGLAIVLLIVYGLCRYHRQRVEYRNRHAFIDPMNDPIHTSDHYSDHYVPPHVPPHHNHNNHHHHHHPDHGHHHHNHNHHSQHHYNPPSHHQQHQHPHRY